MLTPDNFCYWLQGFFEMTDSKTLSEKQIQMIKDHLDLVFKHAVQSKGREYSPTPDLSKEFRGALMGDFSTGVKIC